MNGNTERKDVKSPRRKGQKGELRSSKGERKGRLGLEVGNRAERRSDAKGKRESNTNDDAPHEKKK